MMEGIDSNERLEFLGDAVLGMVRKSSQSNPACRDALSVFEVHGRADINGMAATMVISNHNQTTFLASSLINTIVASFQVVAEQLFRENSSFREGRLTALRKEDVSRKALARIGRDQGLGPYLRISTAEASTGGRNKENALADFVESIIGAVYVDQGLEAARKLISNWLGDMMIEAAESPEGSDFKTRLQEDMRRLRIGQPSYTVTRSGPVHNSRFTAHMLSDAGQRLGWGEGKSKKEAEQAAAEYSLRLIGEMTEEEMASFRAKRKKLADAQVTC